MTDSLADLENKYSLVRLIFGGKETSAVSYLESSFLSRPLVKGIEDAGYDGETFVNRIILSTCAAFNRCGRGANMARNTEGLDGGGGGGGVQMSVVS